MPTASYYQIVGNVKVFRNFRECLRKDLIDAIQYCDENKERYRGMVKSVSHSINKFTDSREYISRLLETLPSLPFQDGKVAGGYRVQEILETNLTATVFKLWWRIRNKQNPLLNSLGKVTVAEDDTLLVGNHEVYRMTLAELKDLAKEHSVKPTDNANTKGAWIQILAQKSLDYDETWGSYLLDESESKLIVEGEI